MSETAGDRQPRADLKSGQGIKTYVGYPMFARPNWCAKCTDCGMVLTKYDFTQEEARAVAESAKAKGGCRC